MSWLSKTWYGLKLGLILAAGANALTGCGFETVYSRYGTSDNTSPGLQAATVHVNARAADPAQRQAAEQFKADLEDLLYPGGSKHTHATYELSTTITTQHIAVAISRDGTVSRYNLVTEANFSLMRLSDNKLLYGDHVRRTGSYNNLTNAYYSAYVSQQDAMQRTITELAEDVRMRLIAYFAQPELTESVAHSLSPATVP